MHHFVGQSGEIFSLCPSESHPGCQPTANVQEARTAEVIHSEFERGFIKSDACAL